MATALKDQFNTQTIEYIAQMIQTVYPAFESTAFIQESSLDLGSLALMDRARHVRNGLAKYLPSDFNAAAIILNQSLGPTLSDARSFDMSAFIYLPHVYFCASHGLKPENFHAAMNLQRELTKRFTAEFSIRAFIEKDPERTLAVLKEWATDSDEHVRRLVSEGSRPRLPWAQKLDCFIKDPAPAIELLELLKDDPSLYVRRSVANHLNDIGKDHPDVLNSIATAWSVQASANRKWIVRHALRVAIKKGDPAALSILGFKHGCRSILSLAAITSTEIMLGDDLQFQFKLENKSGRTEKIMIDFQIHFMKANGSTKPKVFKLKTLTLKPLENIVITKKISLEPRSTRILYAGKHTIDVLLNGIAYPIGHFILKTN